MNCNDIISGYVDVKISARTRRGFTPWKVNLNVYFLSILKRNDKSFMYCNKIGMAETVV